MEDVTASTELETAQSALFQVQQKLSDIRALCVSTYEWRTGQYDMFVDKVLLILNRKA